MEGNMVFDIRNSKAKPDDPLIGATAQVKFCAELKATKQPKRAPFIVQMVRPDGTHVGTLSGLYTLETLPTTAQLVGGQHTEEGSTGKLLCDYLTPPTNYFIKLSKYEFF